MRIVLRFCFVLILVNLSVSCFTQPLWVYSGAPIGDTSIYKYNLVAGLGTTDALTLRHSSGEDSVRLMDISGAPKGVHLYRVDAFPNVNCGLPGMLNNDRYFGLYVIEGTNPAYSLKYFFDGNPYVNSVNKPYLEMYHRLCNSSTACQSWVNMNASMNLMGDTLSKPGMLPVQKEMILTFDNIILPVTLTHFEADWENSEHNSALIYWRVRSEINLHSYVVEKLNEKKEWQEIGNITAGSSSSGAYSLKDTHLFDINYYRLKCIDVSGMFNYSKIILLKYNKTVFLSEPFPNPVNDYVSFAIYSETDVIYNYKIINKLGQVILDGNTNLIRGSEILKIPTTDLPAGSYLLEINAPALGSPPYYKKIIKH